MVPGMDFSRWKIFSMEEICSLSLSLGSLDWFGSGLFFKRSFIIHSILFGGWRIGFLF